MSCEPEKSEKKESKGDTRYMQFFLLIPRKCMNRKGGKYANDIESNERRRGNKEVSEVS
jgi:hypothetical protein